MRDVARRWRAEPVRLGAQASGLPVWRMKLLAQLTISCMLAGATLLAGAQDTLSGDGAVTVEQFGPYTVRASATQSQMLAPATAARHGIEPAADRGVLNVVVLERRADGGQVTVPALVAASKTNLLGQSVPIEMREIRENERVSYLGSFEFAPMRNLRFELSVQPAGSKPLLLRFEDQFVVRSR